MSQTMSPDINLRLEACLQISIYVSKPVSRCHSMSRNISPDINICLKACPYINLYLETYLHILIRVLTDCGSKR